jgi:hypothetical protein
MTESQENPYRAESMEPLPGERRAGGSWQARRLVSAVLLFTGSFGLAVTLGAFALGMGLPRFHWSAVGCSFVMLTAGIWIRR